MKKYNTGDHLNIHSYKHDSKIHRSWDEATYLDENDEFFILDNNFLGQKIYIQESKESEKIFYVKVYLDLH